MDDLDRLFQRLVHNIRNGHAEYLSVPFTVQELYDTLVPYRHYRRDLGIETNQDYEAAVMRLLSGEKSYIRGDQAMQDRLKKEMSTQHPDIGAFRDYADTRISLVPTAVQQLGVSIPTQNAGGFSVGTRGASAQGGNGGAPSEEGTSFSIPALSTLEPSAGCRFCGGSLPEGRTVTYCPHCGQNLAAKHCQGCGTEVDLTWKFCVNCGKKA
ncbi:MAG: zinc ribbon domain-containing protein [Gemmatimonadaceae bacterium]